MLPQFRDVSHFNNLWGRLGIISFDWSLKPDRLWLITCSGGTYHLNFLQLKPSAVSPLELWLVIRCFDWSIWGSITQLT